MGARQIKCYLCSNVTNDRPHGKVTQELYHRNDILASKLNKYTILELIAYRFVNINRKIRHFF